MNVLTEIAVEGTANFVEAQHILLDLVQQENDIVLNGMKERVGEYGTAVALTNVIRRSVNTFVEMQQNFLVLANRRAQGLLQNSEDGEGKDAGNSLVGLASEAMDEFVTAQEKFFDVISEETKGEAEKEHAGKKPARTELVKLAREAADSFIEAQKKLLDLAGQQVNVNLQTASRAVGLKSPIRLLPMADIAGEGVKSFVDAEKALVDSIMKSRTHTHEHAKVTVKAKRHPKPAARRTKATRAKAAHAEAVEV
jgi:hypothetical protein